MKLYITPLSPYARFAPIVVLEKGAWRTGSHVLGLEWQGHAKLVSWLDAVAERPSLASTAPVSP